MGLIARKLFYDKSTGDVFFEIENHPNGTDTTIEYDISIYPILSQRSRDSFDVIQLKHGEYAQDFEICIGKKVNPTTKKLEFIYPDPNQPDAPQVFQKPLTEQVTELKDENYLLQMSVIELSSLAAMQEENNKVNEQAIMELSMMVSLMGGN